MAGSPGSVFGIHKGRPRSDSRGPAYWAGRGRRVIAAAISAVAVRSARRDAASGAPTLMPVTPHEAGQQFVRQPAREYRRPLGPDALAVRVGRRLP